MSLPEALVRLRGEVGSKVCLTILKEQERFFKRITLTRASIKIIDEKLKLWRRIVKRLMEKSIYMELNIHKDKLTLLELKLLDGSGPDYLPGKYPFKVKVFSLDERLLAEYGFGDPRIVLAEIGYTGPTWRDNVDFPLILPYWHNGKTLSIYDSKENLLLSIDISQYATGILEGRIIDSHGNPIPKVSVMAYKDTGDCATYDYFRCSGEDSTYTDSQGNFVLAWLDSGKHIIMAEPSSSYLNLMPSPWKRIEVAKGEIKNLEITLQPAGSISGRIIDSSQGNPITEGEVCRVDFEAPCYAICDEKRAKAKECELGTFIIGHLRPKEYTIKAKVRIKDRYITLPEKKVKVEIGKTTTLNFVYKE